MAKFIKTGKNEITLISNGSHKDGLKVAQWARNLIEKADAIIFEDTASSYKLSAPHLKDVYFLNNVVLKFSDYYFTDINFWLKNCK